MEEERLALIPYISRSSSEGVFFRPWLEFCPLVQELKERELLFYLISWSTLYQTTLTEYLIAESVAFSVFVLRFGLGWFSLPFALLPPAYNRPDLAPRVVASRAPCVCFHIGGYCWDPNTNRTFNTLFHQVRTIYCKVRFLYQVLGTAGCFDTL